MKLEILSEHSEKHQCTAQKDGDWITFSCPDPGCGYRRRYNWRTQETHVTEGLDPFVLHEGYCLPPGLDVRNAPYN